jgi:hypothetical protein
MELFMVTHQQNGQCTSEESREVYVSIKYFLQLLLCVATVLT